MLSLLRTPRKKPHPAYTCSTVFAAERFPARSCSAVKESPHLLHLHLADGFQGFGPGDGPAAGTEDHHPFTVAFEAMPYAHSNVVTTSRSQSSGHNCTVFHPGTENKTQEMLAKWGVLCLWMLPLRRNLKMTGLRAGISILSSCRGCYANNSVFGAHLAGLALLRHSATSSETFASPMHITVSAPPQ